MATIANPAMMKQGVQIANSIRTKLKENRDERKRRDYDEVAAAARNIRNLRERAGELNAGQRRALLEAGPLTQSAHLRVADARADADGAFADWVLRAGRAADEPSTRLGRTARQLRRRRNRPPKRVARRADRAAHDVTEKMTGKRARRAERNRKMRRGGLIAAAVALVLAIGTTVFYALRTRRRAETLTTPPRVEEHAGTRRSELVYSTSTGDTGDAATDTTTEDDMTTEPDVNLTGAGDPLQQQAVASSQAEEAIKNVAHEKVEDTQEPAGGSADSVDNLPGSAEERVQADREAKQSRKNM